MEVELDRLPLELRDGDMLSLSDTSSVGESVEDIDWDEERVVESESDADRSSEKLEDRVNDRDCDGSSVNDEEGDTVRESCSEGLGVASRESD